MVIDSAFSLVRRCALAKLHQFQNICCFYDPGDALVTLVTLVTLLTSRDTSDLAEGASHKIKIPHTGDIESLDRCGS